MTIDTPHKSAALSLALAAALLCPAAFAADAAPAKSDDLASVAKSMPVLVDALSGGSDRACVPTHLTLSGRKKDGSRLFVTALVSQFPEELRKSAKGPAKLTRDQAHEVQRVVDYAVHAQADASGLPPEALEAFSERTGMAMTATMLCLSRESLGAH